MPGLGWVLIKYPLDPPSVHRHPQGDGASQWIQHDAEQPDRHPPVSTWSRSDANERNCLPASLTTLISIGPIKGGIKGGHVICIFSKVVEQAFTQV